MVHWIFGTHSPKVIRASCSFNSCCSFASVDLLNRSANSKNLRLSSSFDRSPVSTRSTSIRLELTFRLFAKALTRLASGDGSETLWRTVFSVVLMSHYTPVCIRMHQMYSEVGEALTVTPPSLPFARGGTYYDPLLAKEGCGEVTGRKSSRCVSVALPTYPSPTPSPPRGEGKLRKC